MYYTHSLTLFPPCPYVIVAFKIAQMHSGKLSVWSQGEGYGTTFTLTLPQTQPSAAINITDTDEEARSTGAFWDCCSTRPPALSSNNVTPFNEGDLMAVSPTANQTDLRAPDTIHFIDTSNPQAINTNLYRGGSAASNMRSESCVLVVDDSRLNRKMTCLVLRELFDNILQAEDGNIAVGRMEEMLALGETVDLVLMDNVMPNKDGPTATRELRELGYKGIIIGVTGNVLPEDVAHFKAHGADDVLAKPMDFDLLKEMLMRTYLLCKYAIFAYEYI